MIKLKKHKRKKEILIQIKIIINITEFFLQLCFICFFSFLQIHFSSSYLYLNDNTFVAKFYETAKFIYKLAKIVFSKHSVFFIRFFDTITIQFFCNVAQTVKDIEPAFICMIRYEEAKYSRYNSDSISML